MLGVGEDLADGAFALRTARLFSALLKRMQGVVGLLQPFILESH